MTVDKLVVAIVVPLVVLAHVEWARRVQSAVPEPYLDEFFHIPQADTYWQGRWSEWDDKITTPPGVYLWSIFVSKFLWLDARQPDSLSPYQLRYTNAVLPYLLAACIFCWERCVGQVSSRYWSAPRVLCIFAFPLFFFFSGLYYTDVFSALTVMCTYCCWQAGLAPASSSKKIPFQVGHLLCGLLALASRQTNIFWVAVFMGGLQVVHTVKQKARIHDPVIAEAYLEDYATMVLSLVPPALHAIPDILLDLWPHLGLLASFAGFVVWNGGVVLGDKTNHVATIHLPQMLYIWPFMLFFSWPVLLPYLAQPRWLLGQVPRYWIVLSGLLAMTAVVHSNTIVHEFLLADNRHYTFYVFKILRHQPWLWYALVPVYAASAWLSAIALGGIPSSSGEKTRKQDGGLRKPRGGIQDKNNCVSFLLVWLISTSLSLVTAPLVEPRYFMVPWLIWRLHVSEESASSARGMKAASKDKRLWGIIARSSFWIELAWSMLINFVTCRIFLKHEFRWPQAPAEVQRFMW